MKYSIACELAGHSEPRIHTCRHARYIIKRQKMSRHVVEHKSFSFTVPLTKAIRRMYDLSVVIFKVQ